MISSRWIVPVGMVLSSAYTDTSLEPPAALADPVGFAAGAGSYTLVIDAIHDLGTLPGHAWSEAHDVNQSGYIVGTSQSDADQIRCACGSLDGPARGAVEPRRSGHVE
jgi:hypothetical protein